MDGGEAILDWLAESGAGIVPFEDRWAWRSRIHLPMEAWQQIERGLEWSGQSEIDGAAVGTLLGEVLRPWTPRIITLDDFRVERVDVRLDTSEDVEIVRTVRLPGSADDDLPPKLLLTDSRLKEKLVVRMGQISAWSKTDLLASFPNMDSQLASRTMEQVAGAFYSADLGEPNVRPDLVVFPEVSIPRPEVGNTAGTGTEKRELLLSQASTGRRSRPCTRPPVRPRQPRRGLSTKPRWQFLSDMGIAVPRKSVVTASANLCPRTLRPVWHKRCRRGDTRSGRSSRATGGTDSCTRTGATFRYPSAQTS